MFISETDLPVFQTDEDLMIFLQENSNTINGIINLTIDDVIVYESIVVNGEKMDSSGLILSKDQYPCTFDGLSHCTQDRIASMNWFDTTGCIIGGFSCVSNIFASCGVDNC